MIGLLGRGDDPCLERVRDAAADRGIPHVLIDEDALSDASLRLDLGVDGVRGVLRTGAGVVDLADDRADAADRLEDDAPVTRTELAHRLRVVGHERRRHGEPGRRDEPGLVRLAAVGEHRRRPTHDEHLGHVEPLVEQGGHLAGRAGRLGRPERPRVDPGEQVEVDDAALARMDRIRDLPTQFQARVEGTDVRVHVVGESVFPTRIASTALDYRYAARDGLACDLEPWVLAPDVEQACIRVASALALPLAGIDLRVGDDGRVTCFEVNPMPAFSYYESNTGQPIAAAVAAFLDRPRTGAARHTDDDESEVA